MKLLKMLFASLILLATAGNTWAAPPGYGHGGYGYGRYGGGHSHVSLGFNFGPYWGPGWYYPPPAYPAYSYYYPPAVVVQQAPPVYIEQPQPVAAVAAAAPPASSYWYYCPASKRYYPYVNTCPSGWQQVSPTPPGP